MKTDPMLDFVKSKLEENEGISADALSRLLVAAKEAANGAAARPRAHRQAAGVFLLAASLALATCGWLFYADAANARRESNLADVIALLRAADGEAAAESTSIPENLLAWQDAPMRDTKPE